MYVKVSNGNVSVYPYSIRALKNDNPNTSFPKELSESVLNDYGVYEVVRSDQPDFDPQFQKVVEVDPVLQDGDWVMSWEIQQKTQEEIDKDNASVSENMRAGRDERLAETDWWAVSDRTMTAEQASYRQALRDITGHTNWPYLNDDDWPTKP